MNFAHGKRLHGVRRICSARATPGLLVGGLLATLLTAVALLPGGREIVIAALDADAAALRRQILDVGGIGVILLVALILAHAAVPYPGGVAAATAGYIYGLAVAAPILLASWVASALLAYWLARAAGRPLARRIMGARRLALAERLVERGGASALIAVRLVPLIPFNAVCYAAGLARVSLARYAWTTLLGIAPFTLTIAYLASRLQDLATTDWRLWLAGGAALSLLLAVRAAAFLRRHRHRVAAPAEGKRRKVASMEPSGHDRTTLADK